MKTRVRDKMQGRRLLAIFVAISMLLSGFAVRTPSYAADGDPIRENVTLGQSGSAEVKSINVGANAVKINANGWDESVGQYLYYGTYGGNPIKFRVLDRHNGTSNTKFNDDTPTMTTAKGDYLLLDSDAVLFKDKLDETSPYSNDYSGSNIYAYLKNGRDKDGNALFSSKEMTAVATTDLAKSNEIYWVVYSYKYKDDETKGNKAFLLSAAEIAQLYRNKKGRVKYGGSSSRYWWERSAHATVTNYAGLVSADGGLTTYLVYDANGVCPAYNLNLESVIFTSASRASKNSDLAKVDQSDEKEFKVTLKDASKEVETTSGLTKSGKTISVPYKYTGNDVDQVSIVLTSGDISKPDTTVLYYGKLADGTNTSGTATFDLPTNLPTGYKAYILAEDLNAGMKTDYASAPVEIEVETLTLNAAKDEAKKAINEAAAKRNGEIDAVQNADADEVKAAKAKVEKEKTDGINAVENANTVKAVNEARDKAVDAIGKVALPKTADEVIADAKKEAKAKIEEAATKKNEEIEKASATAEAKKEAKDKVEKAKAAAIEAVEKAENVAKVGEERDKGITAINEIKVETLDTLNAAKAEAKKAINEAAAKRNGEIDAVKNADADEVKSAKAKVEKEKTDGINAVENASTVKAVSEAKDAAIDAIGKVELPKAGLSPEEKLANAKKDAKAKIEEAATKKNEEIDKASATPEAKQEAKDKVAKAKEAADKAVENADTIAKVDEARDNGITEIGKVEVKTTTPTGKEYEVKFISNKIGATKEEVVETRKIKEGEKVGDLPKELIDENRPDYRFSGWYTKKEGGDKLEAETKIEKEMTIYAHWKKRPIAKNYADVSGNKFSIKGTKNLNVNEGVYQDEKLPKNTRPYQLTVTAKPSRRMLVEWTNCKKLGADIDGYIITRKVGRSDTFVHYATVGANRNYFIDTLPKKNTNYYYMVFGYKKDKMGNITISENSMSAVGQRLDSAKINPYAPKLNYTKKTIRQGESVKLRLTYPKNSISTWTRWRTHNDAVKVAKVNQQGVVTGLNKGKVLVSARTPNGRDIRCLITVI